MVNLVVFAYNKSSSRYLIAVAKIDQRPRQRIRSMYRENWLNIYNIYIYTHMNRVYNIHVYESSRNRILEKIIPTFMHTYIYIYHILYYIYDVRT